MFVLTAWEPAGSPFTFMATAPGSYLTTNESTNSAPTGVSLAWEGVRGVKPIRAKTRVIAKNLRIKLPSLVFLGRTSILTDLIHYRIRLNVPIG
jgi:hypothetical protein